MRKFTILTTLIVLIIGGALFWWRYYYVFGEGVKDGTLNFVIKKGYVFKTWEGRMIQTGLKSESGGMKTIDFDFSISNEKVATTMQTNSGRYFVLHYKEYMGKLPWRGNSNFVVDSIVAVRDVNNEPRSSF